MVQKEEVKEIENNLFLKKVYNLPFKSFIHYRIGTYSDFKKSLLKTISQDPILKKLSLDADKQGYGQALVGMWSYLCDIITFYQERYATESFRRTAQLEDSLTKLLNLIDNTPISGRSASTLIRFIADDKQQPPEQQSSFPIIITQGYKVKSVPDKGQDSIIFETDQSLSITPDHNLLKIDGWRDSFKIIKGTTNIILDKLYPEVDSNDFILITDNTNADVVKVLKKIDNDKKSQIFWSNDEKLRSEYALSDTKIYKFTQIARPFGYNAAPPVISNLRITLYKIVHTTTGTINAPVPLSNVTVQLVDLLNNPVDQSTSDSNGKLSFTHIFPSTYKLYIKKDPTNLNEDVASEAISRDVIMSGYESTFDVNLVTFSGITTHMSSKLEIIFKDKLQIDLTSKDVLTSTIYLDRPYKNLEQESPILIVKDPIDGEIDISTGLYKIAQSSQEFYSAYGISAESTKMVLKQIDGDEPFDFLFTWENIVPSSDTLELKGLVEFFAKYYDNLKLGNTYSVKKSEDDLSLTMDYGKNIFNIKLNEFKTNADLFLNKEKIHTFYVRKNKENGKTDIYRCLIESDSFDIRDSLILTNPALELRADPQFVSLDIIPDKEKITLEGVHINLTAGMLLAITDNTSIILGNIVDSNLNPLKGYTICLYKTQSKGEMTLDSIHGIDPSLKIYCKISDEKGSFLFDNLYSDNYFVSVFLEPQIYWENFGKRAIQRLHKYIEFINSKVPNDSTTNGKISSSNSGIIIDRNTIENNNNFSNIMTIIKNIFSSANPFFKDYFKAENNKNLISAIEISKSLISYLVDKINKEKKNQEIFENKFSSTLDNITNEFTILKDIFDLINIKSILLSKAQYNNIQISASEKPLRDKFLQMGQLIENIQKNIQNMMMDIVLNSSISQSNSLIAGLIFEMLFIITIITESVRIVISALNTLPESEDRNECFIGSTQIINLKPNTRVKVTLTLDEYDKLTYVESVQKQAKIELAKITGDPTFKDGNTLVYLDLPLEYSYVKGLTEVYGNIVPASHGETIKNEILGSGDASIINQEFKLAKTYLSYFNSPLSPNGTKSSLKVFVNDVEWTEQDDFTQSNPTDRHYVSSIDVGGITKIVFGDGIKGSTTITGVDNIFAFYRFGIGSKGNLNPNTPIGSAVDNPSVKSVSIPFGSFGGSDKSLNEQKKVSTSHILTLDKAISLDDYSAIAKNFGDISKALAFESIDSDGQIIIKLVVAASGGRMVVDSAFIKNLTDYLDNRRDTSIVLKIESFVPVPVDIVIEIKIVDRYIRSKVILQVQTYVGPGIYKKEDTDKDNIKKTSALFAFERLNFGMSVYLNEVYSIVGKIPGVEYAVVKKFCRRDSNVLVQDVINSKQNEILQCENDPLDPLKGIIKIIATGGIEF